MSNDKRRQVRVYADNKTYVLHSQTVVNGDKLQIQFNDTGLFSMHTLNNEQWQQMTQSRTTSVRSAGFSCIIDAYACLGVLSISTAQFQISPFDFDDGKFYLHHLVLVSGASAIGTIDNSEIMRITDVYFLPLNTPSSDQSMQQPQQQVHYSSTGNFSNYLNSVGSSGLGGSSSNLNMINNTAMASAASYIADIKKYLSSGIFYYAYSLDPSLSSSLPQFDLTLCSQMRHQNRPMNKKFVWNYNMQVSFRRFYSITAAGSNQNNYHDWLVDTICGCVEIKKLLTLNHSFRLYIISRLSRERSGTRFMCRGIQDDGHCANYVETEQLIIADETGEESSFVQLRGSVPVFFEQLGLQVGTHRIRVSRGLECAYPAFDRHIRSLMHEYGSSPLYILDLLGVKGDESCLSDCFGKLCLNSPYEMNRQLIYRNFDYHSKMKLNKQALGKELWPNLLTELYEENKRLKSVDGMCAYYWPNADGGELAEPKIKSQAKFIRTNCMDCLDRTNNVQSYIGIEMLRFQLSAMQELKPPVNEQDMHRFREAFRQMWILNGDCVSRIYAGTGAIQGKSMTQDLHRSLTRAIQNNFLDSGKQDTIEAYLRSMSIHYGDLAGRVKILMNQNFLNLPYKILRDLISNQSEYTEPINCRLVLGTWNINGGLSSSEMDQLDLSPWLINVTDEICRSGYGYSADPERLHLITDVKKSAIDIFAIGFEEIVDLNASNIVSASDENASKWYSKLFKFLRVHGDYVPVTVEPLQLVGVALFVFVLKKHASHVRDLCIAKTKTGLGGAAGNKGAVMVRLVFYNTSMCFVCSHFAAHQNKVKERNDDFRQIYEQSEFVGPQHHNLENNKLEVKSHDYVFWMGDLNYRIDMANDRCRQLIAEKQWSQLVEVEQLSVQRQEQQVFVGFQEAPLHFPPSYKYNVYEDSYDRSEKCRVPAWTDRILWRRRPITRRDQDQQAAGQFPIGNCLYYGRADIRLSDHRPVSSVLEIQVNRVQHRRLLEQLQSSLRRLHPFPVTVEARLSTGSPFDEQSSREIHKWFAKYKSLVTWKSDGSILLFTYADGFYALEACADLNNKHLTDTVSLNVKTQQGKFEELCTQEIQDCMAHLHHNLTGNQSQYTQQMSIDEIGKKPEVKVENLLDLSFHEEVQESSPSDSDDDETSFISVPAQIHTTMSIANHIHNLSSADLSQMKQQQKRDSLNFFSPPATTMRQPTLVEQPEPLVKCLSNSNLTQFEDDTSHENFLSFTAMTSNNKAHAHSAVNLLDLVDDHPSTMLQQKPLPQRPPPPPPSYKKIENSNLQPLITIEPPSVHASAASFSAFDDDFASLQFHNTSAASIPPPLPPLPTTAPVVQKPPPLPPQVQMARPPPLPPAPPKLKKEEELPQATTFKTVFSLFDNEDDNEEEKSEDDEEVTRPPIANRPPPLPPLIQQSKLTTTAVKSAPPPLPLFPSKNANIEFSDDPFSNPFQDDFGKMSVSDLLNNNNNQESQKREQQKPPPLPPLPPPRPNHFN